MKVKCISNKVDLEKMNWLKEWYNASRELELTVEETYVVLAIAKYSNHLFYYVLADDIGDFPLAFPCHLFEVEDYNISKYWDTKLKLTQLLTGTDIGNQEIISFSEWSIKGDVFYENLLEGGKYETNLFINYRDKMTKE